MTGDQSIRAMLAAMQDALWEAADVCEEDQWYVVYFTDDLAPFRRRCEVDNDVFPVGDFLFMIQHKDIAEKIAAQKQKEEDRAGAFRGERRREIQCGIAATWARKRMDYLTERMNALRASL